MGWDWESLDISWGQVKITELRKLRFSSVYKIDRHRN